MGINTGIAKALAGMGRGQGNVGLKITGQPRDLLEEVQLKQLKESMSMPGNFSLPGSYATKDLSKGAALGLTTGMGLGGGLGMSDLTEGFTESAKLENSIFANPEELGRQAARAKMSLEELMDKARQEAERIGQIPQIYFLQIQGGYQDEMNRQQEQEPKQIYDEDIEGGARPVSLFMAEGGEAIGDELEGMGMSEEQAQEELESMRPEFEQLQMLANVVKKLLAEGMSESEIVAYLKEQGLDDEDVETLFAFLQEMSGQEAVAEEQSQGIDQQIAGMM